MRFASIALAAAAALALATPGAASPTGDLNTISDEYWAAYLRANPTYASQIGHREYDTQLGDVSLAGADRQAELAARLLARLSAIPEAGLSPTDRTNKAILKRTFEATVQGNRFGQRMMLFSNRSGWHQNLADLADSLTFRSKADYENYLTRLAAYPALNDEALRVSSRALTEGFVLPCAAMTGFDQTISGVIPADGTKSRLYAPFAAERPPAISATDWSALQGRARSLIEGDLRAAYAKHLAWYQNQYAPRCAKAVGVSSQPNGRAYYDWLIGQHTTTTMTADEVHALGLREVARIRADMEKVAKGAGFATREAYIADLRTNPKYYAKTPEELMQFVAREAKKIDGEMPRYFTVLARLPYGIKEIPPETAEGQTTAYYNQGSPDQGIAAFYYVNTSKLDQRPLWEVPVLTVHEAVPGHHQQIALQQELPLPEWRRYSAFFTAFVEGWGLYSEHIGIPMGLYDTPAKEMGRLSYQMWRATRLVVDTGIHAKGWSKERAVAYMLDNTALSPANIEAEVNRYIANPGQALAYKIGEMKISGLRSKAEKALGPKFDLRRFHDAVLGQGSVPMDALEAQIDAWIESEKSRT